MGRPQSGSAACGCCSLFHEESRNDHWRRIRLYESEDFDESEWRKDASDYSLGRSILLVCRSRRSFKTGSITEAVNLLNEVRNRANGSVVADRDIYKTTMSYDDLAEAAIMNMAGK